MGLKSLKTAELRLRRPSLFLVLKEKTQGLLASKGNLERERGGLPRGAADPKFNRAVGNIWAGVGGNGVVSRSHETGVLKENPKKKGSQEADSVD